MRHEKRQFSVNYYLWYHIKKLRTQKKNGVNLSRQIYLGNDQFVAKIIYCSDIVDWNLDNLITQLLYPLSSINYNSIIYLHIRDEIIETR